MNPLCSKKTGASTVGASTVSSSVKIYRSYLKSKYLKKTMPDIDKWPPLPSKKYVNLAVIERGRLSRQALVDNSRAFTYGNIGAVYRKSDITFDDVAKPDKDGELPRFVLVEGAPGVGKSTFAWEACRKWAEGEILEEFDLVILIRLRDESVRRATCLGDLIQYPRDQKVRHKVIEEVTKTDGKGVLFLLEGYDELPTNLREGALFREVIQGYQFYEGTILLTSRHWASEHLLLPYTSTKRPVSQHIEILGFTSENVEEYLSCMLEDQPSLLQDMKQYLELCPHIRSMMYIPLNCAIVLEVYRYSKKQNSLVPQTMTELYSSLIRSLLLRHICDLPEYRDKPVALEDLTKLPSCIQDHFCRLAKLAYEGISNSQQIIFREDEIPSDLDNLGLLQSSMELYVDIGAKKSFNFPHLTIQEFLAAYHIATFFLIDQLDCLVPQRYSDMVCRFLCGLSPSLPEKMDSHDQGNKREYVVRLFEAKLKLPSFTYLPLNSHDISDPFHSYVLGYLIGTGSEHHDVLGLFARVVTREMFFSGLSNGDPGLLTMHLHIKKNVGQEFFYPLQESDKLKRLHAHCEGPYAVLRLAESLYVNHTLEELTITIKGDAGVEHVLKMLRKNKTLKKLAVDTTFSHECAEDLYVSITSALCSNSTLTGLNLLSNKKCIITRGSESISKMLRENKHLVELNLISCVIGTSEGASKIVRALQYRNSTLEKLCISICDIGPNVIEAFTSMLKKNTTLNKLDIVDSKFGHSRKTVVEWVNMCVLINNSLQHNRIIVELKITSSPHLRGDLAGNQIQKMFLAKCTKDERLHLD